MRISRDEELRLIDQAIKNGKMLRITPDMMESYNNLPRPRAFTQNTMTMAFSENRAVRGRARRERHAFWEAIWASHAKSQPQDTLP